MSAATTTTTEGTSHMSAIALDPAAPIDQPRRGRIRRALLDGRRKYAAGLLALLLLPGSAYAAWSVQSSGQGGVKFSSLSAPTVNQAGTLTADAYPGTTASLQFKIDNPNPGTLQVTNIAPATGQDAGTCASSLTVKTMTLATPVSVPSGAAQVVTIPNAVDVAASTPTTCQGTSASKGATLTFGT